MKALLSVLVIFSSLISQADIPRPGKTGGFDPSILSQITQGTSQVKMVLPKCATDPIRRCAAMPSTVVELTLPLVGCLDKAIVSYSVLENPKNSDVKVTVSALNVADPKSASARCVVAPTAVKTLSIGGPRMNGKNVTVEFVQNYAQ